MAVKVNSITSKEFSYVTIKFPCLFVNINHKEIFSYKIQIIQFEYRQREAKTVRSDITHS
jgi:hypothetical protein